MLLFLLFSVMGHDYNFSVDWWALGVLLFEMLAGRSPFDISNAPEGAENAEEYLFQVIKERAIRVPRSISVKAQSVLNGFLKKDPAERLGCNIENGFQEIQQHPFFKSIDWVAVIIGFQSLDRLLNLKVLLG